MRGLYPAHLRLENGHGDTGRSLETVPDPINRLHVLRHSQSRWAIVDLEGNGGRAGSLTPNALISVSYKTMPTGINPTIVTLRDCDLLVSADCNVTHRGCG